MSFSRAGQQDLHFLYVLDSSNSRTKTAWAARCLTPKPVQQHPKKLSSTSKAAAASFTPAALDSMDSSSSQGLDSSSSQAVLAAMFWSTKTPTLQSIFRL
jgi:hypothetical protein